MFSNCLEWPVVERFYQLLFSSSEYVASWVSVEHDVRWLLIYIEILIIGQRDVLIMVKVGKEGEKHPCKAAVGGQGEDDGDGDDDYDYGDGLV